MDADDIEVSGVSGDESEALVIYQHTGNEATARLLFYIDTGTGFPIAENPGTITIQDDGRTQFSPNPEGRHHYLTVAADQK